MKNVAVLTLMLAAAACAVSDEEPVSSPGDSVPAELAPKAIETSPSLAPVTPLNPLNPLNPVTPSCEPGPPSNWCSNREGRSCPSEGVRSRCYIPNYCEWALLQCQGGIWVIIG